MIEHNPEIAHHVKEKCCHLIVENGVCRMCNCKVKKVFNVCGYTGLYRKVENK